MTTIGSVLNFFKTNNEPRKSKTAILSRDDQLAPNQEVACSPKKAVSKIAMAEEAMSPTTAGLRPCRAP